MPLRTHSRGQLAQQSRWTSELEQLQFLVLTLSLWQRRELMPFRRSCLKFQSERFNRAGGKVSQLALSTLRGIL